MSWWPAKYFLARTNPDFGRSNNGYYNLFFAYGIPNYAGNRLLYCTDVQVFGSNIHTLLSSCPRFSPIFMSVYIYLEYHCTAVSEVSKVRPISAYRWNLIFFVAWHVIKSLLHEEETSLIIFQAKKLIWREICSTKSVFIIRTINIQQKKEKRNHYSIIEQNTLSENYMENIIKCSHPKMTGQNDQQDESLTGQVHDQAGHCPLTGRYFELCILSGSPNECWLHTCSTYIITTWRLGLRAPLVARNNYFAKFLSAYFLIWEIYNPSLTSVICSKWF